MKLPEPRRFNYRFRYYNPDDEDGKKIHFKRIRKSKQPARGSSLRLVVILALVLIIMFFLLRGKSTLFTPSSDTITIEEIEIVD